MKPNRPCHVMHGEQELSEAGARMGDAIITMKTRESVLAISSPTKRSRTRAMAMTAEAAAPAPCSAAKRHQRVEVGDEIGRGGGKDINSKPRKQRITPSETVGQWPEDELQNAEAHHVGGDHQLAAVFIRLAQGRADLLQPWQHDVDGKGVDGNHRRQQGNELNTARAAGCHSACHRKHPCWGGDRHHSVPRRNQVCTGAAPIAQARGQRELTGGGGDCFACFLASLPRAPRQSVHVRLRPNSDLL